MTMFDHWYARNKDNALEWLRDIHRHPETGGDEVRTAALVAGRLGELGFDVVTGVGGTGVAGTLHGEKSSAESPGRNIGSEFVFDPEIVPIGAAIFADLVNIRGSSRLNSRGTVSAQGAMSRAGPAPAQDAMCEP